MQPRISVKEQRLIGTVQFELAQLSNATQATIELLNKVQRCVSNATFALAELEAIRLRDRETIHKLGTEVDEVEDKMAEKVRLANEQVNRLLDTQTRMWGAISNLNASVDRLITDDVDDELPAKPVPGVEYVDMVWMTQQAKCSDMYLRKLVSEGKLPGHHAVAPGSKRRLWAKQALDDTELWRNILKRKAA